ncbi:ADP-ribosylglycohydrolase family protein [Nocardia sp. alder85J]|uniref:ADP-ribosylglycohydrolase family protein n=1 Tax=Nocardia sp. alder85J TaxID=2862949 RepID=UPI001CD51613|nr:ADP-ribosylglycohydrolase family protein [Nocardia sp. alder85J]MCX4096308.1 ADP-ribosylglycohydrolase family protein [Nocardia sp. alder85J]
MDSIDPAGFTHLEADPRALLHFEWLQRRESGYDVDDFAEEVRDLARAIPPRAADCWRLLNRIEASVRDPGWPYDEDPADGAARAVDTAPPAPPARFYDRILGGWLGRCVGSTLGKPLDNGLRWSPQRIRAYLERADAYPLTDYVPVLAPMPEGYELQWGWPESTRDRIEGCPRDDDLDYPVLGLHMLEQFGTDFTAAEAAAEWLQRLPFLQTVAAERVAYRNLIDGALPPATARRRNPYREWAGALSRADIYGYVYPGDPAAAAQLAARDAAISHTGNGVWAAMWAAALVAAAFTATDARAAATTALTVIPEHSRLAVALTQVLDDHDRGVGWAQATATAHARHDHYPWGHAIPIACLASIGILWGAGDFTETVGLTVQAGGAAGRTAATAGSVCGVLLGATAIPEHWTTPLRDRLHSAVAGYDGVRISDLARRTFDLSRLHVLGR